MGVAFLLDWLVKHGPSGANVRALGGNYAGELRITRFLRFPKVKPGAMFETAAARTATLVKVHHILAIQDTTTLHDDGRQRSLALHPSIAVDADNSALLGPCARPRPASHRWQKGDPQNSAIRA